MEWQSQLFPLLCSYVVSSRGQPPCQQSVGGERVPGDQTSVTVPGVQPVWTRLRHGTTQQPGLVMYTSSPISTRTDWHTLQWTVEYRTTIMHRGFISEVKWCRWKYSNHQNKCQFSNFHIRGSTAYIRLHGYEVELLEVWPVTIKLYVIKLQ